MRNIIFIIFLFLHPCLLKSQEIYSIDLISDIRQVTKKPVGAYHVSGEFASLKILDKSKLINFDKATSEVWDTFKRAGAQYIISYAARHAKRIYFKG